MTDSMGCGDSSCIFRVIRPKGGQHTNGGCRCFEQLISWDQANSRWNRDEVRKVQRDTIRLRGAYGEAMKVLKTLEFSGSNGKCPVCLGWNKSDNGETPGVHTDTCLVDKVLSQK